MLVHYQTNYFTILEKLNFKITDKRNLFFLDKSYQNQYDDFYKKFIQKQFCLFHFDEKWNRLKLDDYTNSLKIINKFSKTSLLSTQSLERHVSITIRFTTGIFCEVQPIVIILL